MTDQEYDKLKALAQRLIDATSDEIEAKGGPAKFVEYCEAVRDRLLVSHGIGRLKLTTLVGLKANLTRAVMSRTTGDCRTDAEVLKMVQEVFPNASIVHEPTVAEVERDVQEAARLNGQLELLSGGADEIKNESLASPISSVDDDDLPW